MLSDTQCQQFREQGYLVIEDVVDLLHIEALTAEYEERMTELYQQWYSSGSVKEAPEGLPFWEKLDQCRSAGVEWFQPFDISLPGENIREDTPMHFGSAIFDIVTHQRILDIVECLIGSEITSNPIQHVRIKPPQREVPEGEARAHITSTAWHQDRGVGLEASDNTEMVTVWIAVNDATVENGCLQVIPGPHDMMLPHCPQIQTAIAEAFLASEKAIPLPIKAGGIVLFDPLTPHASLPNTSKAYRWSFDLRYNVTGQHTGRQHFPEFIARSKTDPSTELHDWRRWKQLWEEARVRVANEPHIEQHRWQSDSPFCA